LQHAYELTEQPQQQQAPAVRVIELLCALAAGSALFGLGLWRGGSVGWTGFIDPPRTRADVPNDDGDASTASRKRTAPRIQQDDQASCA
jgi:hypothetical protein